MRTRLCLTAIAVTALLAGCGENNDTSGSGGSTGTTTASGGAGGGGASAGDTFEFDTETYTLQPGEEQTYMCYTTRIPEGEKMRITEVIPTYGKAIHHLGVYQMMKDEPEGVFNCPELTRDNWLPIYGGGIESGSLKMPEGAALTVPGGRQVLVQLHLLNASGDVVTDKAHILFRTSKAPDLVNAGIFGFDNRDLHIPAHTNDAMEQQTCSPIGRDMDVFAVFGHMHQRGKKIEVSRGASPGDEVLYSATWTFQDQPTVPSIFHVSKDDNIHVRCWYDNPDDFEVNYGEKTANEMCSFVFYYTPFTTLFGCLKTAP